MITDRYYSIKLSLTMKLQVLSLKNTQKNLEITRTYLEGKLEGFYKKNCTTLILSIIF